MSGSKMFICGGKTHTSGGKMFRYDLKTHTTDLQVFRSDLKVFRSDLKVFRSGGKIKEGGATNHTVCFLCERKLGDKIKESESPVYNVLSAQAGNKFTLQDDSSILKMKRLFFTLFFFLAYAASVSATPVTVSSYTDANWQKGGTSASLRIFLSDRIVTSDGHVLNKSVSGGNSWYKQIDCSVSGTNLTCPSFIIDSTEDSSVPTAQYTFVFYKGNSVVSTFGKFRVPPSPNPTTFADFVSYNKSETANLPTNAVSDNDSVYKSAKTSTYLRDYADLTAVADNLKGATADVIVDRNTNITSNTTLPANVHLKLVGDGKFNVSSGATLVIGAGDLPNKRIFDGAGTVYVARGGANEINLAWWQNPDSKDITTALNAAIKSLFYSAGGRLIIPGGDWTYAGGSSGLPLASTVEGVGGFISGGVATTITLTGTNTHIFKIGEITHNVTIKNLTLKATSKTGTIGVLLEGRAPNTSNGVTLDQLSINGFYTAVKVNSLANAWQLENLRVSDNFWVNNTYGFHSTTNNSSYIFDNVYLSIPDYGIGYKFDLTGQTMIRGGNILGGNLYPCINGNPDPRAAIGITVSNDHLPINIISTQSENLGWFLSNDISLGSSSINLIGNLIQSPIRFNQSGYIYSFGNQYARNVFRDTPSAPSARVLSFADGLTAQNTNSCGQVGTPELSGFTNGSRIVTEWDNENAAHIWRERLDILQPEGYVAARPTVRIGSPTTDQILMRLGLADENGNFSKYYDFRRNNASGYLELTNTGDSTKGLNITNGNLSAANVTAQNQLTTVDAQIAGQLNYQGKPLPVSFKGTAAIDPPGITAGRTVDVTFTLTGVAANDLITVFAPSGGLTDGIIIGQARYLSANTATVRIGNLSAGTIDLPRATYSYVIQR